MRIAILLSAVLCCFIGKAQITRFSGSILDAKKHEAISGASIAVFKSQGNTGTISNPEGRFSMQVNGVMDSVRVSAIGYRSLVLNRQQLLLQESPTLLLEPEPELFDPVIVKPVGVMEILHKTIAKLRSAIPVSNFENKAFYREIIRDSQIYYSVAEAVFKAQFFPQKKTTRLELVKGRSKEDITYSRLFEDFHPGGGPEEAINLSFIRGQPDFLNEDKIKNFIYIKEHSVSFDGRPVYIIRFDQKPGIKEALEAGEIYIYADDYSILKYEAKNSPLGTPYIKSLRGTDKLFAELLHIDFTIKGWSKSATYYLVGDKLYLNNDQLSYFINYKQAKKNLDINLTIQTEFMVTEFRPSFESEIEKDKEWRRKNMVANLPADFDPDFWGSNNVLSPTLDISEMIAAISKRNNEPDTASALKDWDFLHKDYFFASMKGDSLNLVSLMKSSWDDGSTGGMLYKNINGNFSMEAKINIHKRSDASQGPENGFQQAGIIVRREVDNKENNLIFSMGTGGNEKPKYFLKRTSGDKTKTLVVKTDSLSAWLKLERKEKHITVYKKSNIQDSWSEVADYDLDWLSGSVQVGFSIMARFAGDGPKQHPDIKAVFSDIKFLN